jgi:hypothetical protein
MEAREEMYCIFTASFLFYPFFVVEDNFFLLNFGYGKPGSGLG